MLTDWPDLAPDRPADGTAPTLSDAELLTMAVMSALLAAAAWLAAHRAEVFRTPITQTCSPRRGRAGRRCRPRGWRRSWHCRRCTITRTARPPRRSASTCGGRWPAGWRSMTTVSTRHRWCTGGTGSPARSAAPGQRRGAEDRGGNGCLARPAPRGGLHDPGGRGSDAAHRHPADQRHGVGPDCRRAWLATEIRRHQMPRWHEPAAGVHAVTPGGYSASRRDYDGRRVVSPVIAGLQAGPGRAVRPWHGWLGCHCNGGKREEAIGR